jgi:hypothetical protein
MFEPKAILIEEDKDRGIKRYLVEQRFCFEFSVTEKAERLSYVNIVEMHEKEASSVYDG